MKNIEDINKEAIKKIVAEKITDFSPGDTIKVGVKIIDEKEKGFSTSNKRFIAKKNRDLKFI